ncbi:hypothetical protein KEM52_003798 [Ascosphaera acerosa]|nr:hypothetical protein KEM52_003798 [Ascosphaera acerosa]
MSSLTAPSGGIRSGHTKAFVELFEPLWVSAVGEVEVTERGSLAASHPLHERTRSLLAACAAVEDVDRQLSAQHGEAAVIDELAGLQALFDQEVKQARHLIKAGLEASELGVSWALSSSGKAARSARKRKRLCQDSGDAVERVFPGCTTLLWSDDGYSWGRLCRETTRGAKQLAQTVSSGQSGTEKLLNKTDSD